jgi:hypothetical protein
MSKSKPGRESGGMDWPDRLKRTPTRALWFDRIRSLPPGLELGAIATKFKVAKTTAHTWCQTFGYTIHDTRGSRPHAAQTASFEAVAEDGSRHVILIMDGPPAKLPRKPAATRVLVTTRNQRVYRVSKGIYQFVATGQRLISKDPVAP